MSFEQRLYTSKTPWRFSRFLVVDKMAPLGKE